MTEEKAPWPEVPDLIVIPPAQPIAPESRWQRLASGSFVRCRDGRNETLHSQYLNALEAEVSVAKKERDGFRDQFEEYMMLNAKAYKEKEAEVAALRVKAELADRLADVVRNLGVVQIQAWPLMNEWLADYDAAQKAQP